MSNINYHKTFTIMLIWFLAFLLYSSRPQATELDNDNWLESAKSALVFAHEILELSANQTLDHEQITLVKKIILPIRAQAQDCVEETEMIVRKRQHDLDLLDPKISTEAKDVSLVRHNLAKEHDTLEKHLIACRFILIQAKDFKEKIAAIEQATLTRKLLIRGSDLRHLIQDNLNHPEAWWKPVHVFLMKQSGLQLLTHTDLLTLVGASILGFFGGRRLYRNWLATAKKPCVDKCTHFWLALKSCSTRLLSVMGAIGVPLIYLMSAIPVTPIPFLTLLTYSLLAFTLMRGVINSVFHPDPPANHYLALDKDTAQALGKRLKMLLSLGLVGVLLFGSDFSNTFSDNQYLLVRALFGVLLVANLTWILWLVGRIPTLAGTHGIRFLLIAALFFALGAEWLGYRNLSIYVMIGLLGSLAGFGIIWFANSLMTDLFDGMEFGYQPWQKRLRQHLGLKDQDHVPGLIWIRLIFSVVIWSGLVLWVLWVWGLSQQGIDFVQSILQEGFQIGTFRVVPLQIVIAVLTFSLLNAVSGWFKQKAVPKWLVNARIDHGSRDALITVTGYFGLTVSLLVALSIAGFEFANIAIIAGALSVGIGFGLQNIVNNFISGLILLIERPIRTGDWILVGATEGFVRRISIRSTQLRTFDGSDIIVPNSELVSSQVTNWMLHDSWGCIKIPVGVAYGSDLDKVRNIILAVADQHDMVITESKRVSAPVVLMTGFGDNALNLELRCFIKIIDQRAQIFSDLCFAINAAFRTEGIEIPFPQHDVHLKDPANH